MKLSFNAPVVLGFTFVAAIVFALSEWVIQDLNVMYFASTGHFNFSDPFDYFRLGSHAIGHANWEHLLGNFAIILLIGPILEERYGSKNLLIMMAVTAIVTGILNNVLWDTGLLGASGIVFMMILLSSLVSFKSGTIPLTFILVAALYLGQEIYAEFTKDDNISHFAHILGGVCGMLFGFVLGAEKKAGKDFSGKGAT